MTFQGLKDQNVQFHSMTSHDHENPIIMVTIATDDADYPWKDSTFRPRH